MAGATAVAVAAAGAIAGLETPGSGTAAADANAVAVSSAVVDRTPAAAAATTDQAAVTAAALAARDARDAATRGKARDLLASRVAAVEQQAAAASAQRLAVLQKSCKYNPNVQRTPQFDPTQVKNAQTIIDVAKQLGLPVRAQVIALATAWQESNLINMSGGDRDSVGLFQQRPSMGWGRYSQVHDPVYAAKQFFYALQAVPGWDHLPLTVAAQTVQGSAFPWAYARWEKFAADLVTQLTRDYSPEDLNCMPD